MQENPIDAYVRAIDSNIKLLELTRAKVIAQAQYRDTPELDADIQRTVASYVEIGESAVATNYVLGSDNRHLHFGMIIEMCTPSRPSSPDVSIGVAVRMIRAMLSQWVLENPSPLMGAVSLFLNAALGKIVNAAADDAFVIEVDGEGNIRQMTRAEYESAQTLAAPESRYEDLPDDDVVNDDTQPMRPINPHSAIRDDVADQINEVIAKRDQRWNNLGGPNAMGEDGHDY